MEREVIAEQKKALLPEEIGELRAEMYSKISDALSLGIFTTKEAGEWRNGFEACTELSHMENLISIIDNFIASGVATVSKIENLLQTDLITSAEKQYWRNHIESTDYSEKKQLIAQLNGIIRELNQLKAKLWAILENQRISQQQKNQLINKFKSASSPTKGSVINEAKQLIKKQQIKKIKIIPQPTTVKTKAVKSLPVVEKSTLSPEITRKNLKVECQKMIAYYVKFKQFKEARNVLDGSKELFNLKEYSTLSKAVDISEIKNIGLGLKAV